MTLSLALLSVCQYMDNSIGSVIAVILIQSFLANSATTVTWLYMAEIMRVEAMSIAFFVYWAGSLVVSQIALYILKATSGGTLFLIFACFTFVDTILIVIFMKETKGLTQKECEILFKPQESESDNDSIDRSGGNDS